MFYVLPITGSGTPIADAIRPKYVYEIPIHAWQFARFGQNAIMWTAESNVDAIASLEANADVVSVPPLDNNVAVNATKTALENLNIPSQWITGGMTYRDVLRTVVGMGQLVQQCSLLGLNLPLSGGHLDDTMAQLNVDVRQTLINASDALKLDRTGISGQTTVRVALKILGQQFIDGNGVQLGDL